LGDVVGTKRRESVFAPGFRAVRANIKPFLVIQALAVVLLVTYYASPGFQSFGETLSGVKERWGLAFAGLTTAFAGFALPGVVKKATGMPAAKDARDVCFQIGFFILIGIFVDVLYRGLSVVFGTGTDIGTVATKVVVDQLVFSPLVSIPFSTTAFAWQESGYSVPRLSQVLRGGGFGRRYGPLLATCWAYWIPILCVVYALPSGLQFWMFLCAQGAWSLLLIHLGTRSHSPNEEVAA